MDDITTLSAEMEDDVSEKRKGMEADPHDFGAAEQALNDAAKRVNAVWITFVLLCVYFFIATYTVTPAVLFRDAPVKLPIFNADLPLKVYFLLAPFLVLSLHAYLIVLAKGLAEKIDTYEDILRRSSNMSARIATGRRALRSRLDTSIIVRAMSARYRETRGFVDMASGVIAGLTMTILPVALLLLTQLIFLPYQEQWLTWVHRGFIILDVAMCLWLLRPFSLAPWPVITGQLSVVALILFAAATSICFAAFPGEWIYTMLSRHWPHVLTAKVFEGPLDPVDYVHKGGVLPFPNRLIPPDDPKLIGIVDASPNSVSLSVRGRNFRRAVFDRSNLTGVDFSAADLTGASLQGAKLEGATFECGTPGNVTFEPFDATRDVEREASRDCAILQQVNLSNASLDNAKFQETKMADAKLGRASLKGALFRKARMNGAILQAAALEGANFSGAELFGANFNWARGNNVNFFKARMTASTFVDAWLFAANFNDARLQGARFARATLIAANFNDAHIQAANLSGAKLLAASFRRAYLQNATLDGANIKGTLFGSTSLHGASLKCLTPFRTDFVHTDLLETVVTGKCATESYADYSFDYGSWPDTYDLKDDRLPAVGYDEYWTDSGFEAPSYDIYESPEKLSAKEFEIQLNEKVLSSLPEVAKSRLREAFERLKPEPRNKPQDEAEKTFWAGWATRSASPKSHAEALATRLESIACVAEGAPYVARGLLHRFTALRETEEQSEVYKNRIIARLKAASDGSDFNCLGAKGLLESDFSSIRSQ